MLADSVISPADTFQFVLHKLMSPTQLNEQGKYESIQGLCEGITRVHSEKERRFAAAVQLILQQMSMRASPSPSHYAADASLRLFHHRQEGHSHFFFYHQESPNSWDGALSLANIALFAPHKEALIRMTCQQRQGEQDNDSSLLSKLVQSECTKIQNDSHAHLDPLNISSSIVCSQNLKAALLMDADAIVEGVDFIVVSITDTDACGSAQVDRPCDAPGHGMPLEESGGNGLLKAIPLCEIPLTISVLPSVSVIAGGECIRIRSEWRSLQPSAFNWCSDPLQHRVLYDQGNIRISVRSADVTFSVSCKMHQTYDDSSVKSEMNEYSQPLLLALRSDHLTKREKTKKVKNVPLGTAPIDVSVIFAVCGWRRNFSNMYCTSTSIFGNTLQYLLTPRQNRSSLKRLRKDVQSEEESSKAVNEGEGIYFFNFKSLRPFRV